MTLAEQITLGSQQQSKILSETLSGLGRQISSSLADKEYQRQATATLPAMRQSYNDAFNKMKSGDIAGGYMDLVGASMMFGSTNNPYLMKHIDFANKAAKDAASTLISQGWQDIQRSRMMGEATGGLPAATPRERAEQALLGQEPQQAYNAPIGDSRIVEPPLPGEGEDVDFTATPDAMQGVGGEQQPDMQSVLENMNTIANGAKSEKFKNALKDASKNPMSEESLAQLQSAISQYKNLDDASKTSVFDSQITSIQSKQELENIKRDKSFYQIDGADRIIGKGITGVILKPSVTAKGTTIGKSQSVTYGTNEDDLTKFEKGLSGAVSELNRGKLGDFISNQGGARNVYMEFAQEEDEDGDIKQNAYLINKSNPKERFKVVGPSNYIQSISTAINMIDNSAAQLQAMNNAGSTASLIRLMTPKSEGPTREAVRGMRTPRSLGAIFE